jgi:hypothetical protein
MDLGFDKSFAFPILPIFLLYYFHHIKGYGFVYIWPKFQNCSLII